MTQISSNPSIPLNPFTTEPNLSDLLDLLKKEIFFDLNCHHLATIQSFNPQTQTVSATINYTKTFFTLSLNGTYSPSQEPYPQLVDMPIIILGGGTAGLTFPVKQGDQCVVMFNDRSIDNWYQSGQTGPLSSGKAHSLSDGIAIIGPRNLNTLLQNYDTMRALLFNGTTGVGVGASQVKIYNAINGSLGTNFTAFFTALNTFMESCEGSSTDPTLAAAATAFATAMEVPVAPSSEGPIENIEGILE